MSVLEQLAGEIGISANALAQQLQQTAAAEQLDPNYLTLSPTTGLVGADFTGHVHAQGLDLDEATNLNINSQQNQVQWKRTNGTVGEILAGGRNPGVATQLALVATAPAGSADFAAIVTTVTGGNNASQSPQIIDSTGASNFLQLLSAQQLQLVFGTAQTGVAFGPGNQNQPAIPHGLGRAPVLAGGFSLGWAGAIGSWGGADATNVYLVAVANQAVGANVFFYWFAIG